ncbi:RNA pseudouridine synthase [Acetobacteraceae bacterium]|nr:RNA pseudouridine synthase [Acetobacteraceae bacterium]
MPHLMSQAPLPKEDGARFFRKGMTLPLLYLSPHFAVIAKPAGMAVYPTKNTSHKTVEEYLQPQKRGGPWLVHRLDQDTAGCLLIARRKTALIAAQNLFAGIKNTKNLSKIYWAILEDVLDPSLGDSGEITVPLYKIRKKQKWFMQACPDVNALPSSLRKEILPAKTKWKKRGEHNGKTWIELELLTGRTHQARVHCQFLGAAILGDTLYSQSTAAASQPLCLLARSLFLQLPSSEKIEASMPPPDFMTTEIQKIHPDFISSSVPFLGKDPFFP